MAAEDQASPGTSIRRATQTFTELSTIQSRSCVMHIRFLAEGESPESPTQQLLTSVLGDPLLWVRWMTKEEAE